MQTINTIPQTNYFLLTILMKNLFTPKVVFAELNITNVGKILWMTKINMTICLIDMEKKELSSMANKQWKILINYFVFLSALLLSHIGIFQNEIASNKSLILNEIKTNHL